MGYLGAVPTELGPTTRDDKLSGHSLRPDIQQASRVGGTQQAEDWKFQLNREIGQQGGAAACAGEVYNVGIVHLGLCPGSISGQLAYDKTVVGSIESY